MFARVVQQLAATRGVAQELHPEKKGWFGSSRKKKSKKGSTQQSVASVSVEAVVPQSSMMEVFSRAWNRRRHSRGVRANLAQGDEDAFDQMCHDANSSLMFSATVAAGAPSVQLTVLLQDVVSVPVEVGPAAAPVPVAGVPLLDIEETALDAYVTPTRPPTAALRQPGAPQRRPTTPLTIAQNFMVEVTTGDEASSVAEPAAEEDVPVASATEAVEGGVELGGGDDDEDASDIPLGKMGLASSLFKLQERQAHPQLYILLKATRRGTRVICLCDSGAASFNLMSEVAYLSAAQSDPTRFGSLTYRLHPLQVGGIEEGRPAVPIVGQVMQALYAPKQGNKRV